MKIGILTFHSSLNYGGVLQCWALVQVLRRMGHDVVVIDRWYDYRRSTIFGEWAGFHLKGWLRILYGIIRGSRQLDVLVRRQRTAKFLSHELGLTKYYFCMWHEAPKNLGVDGIVVGSDQVWNPYDAKNNGVYLLEGAPSLPAIGYGLSFGVTKIPDELISKYKTALKRFCSVSAREADGVRLISVFGGNAQHVVDPTILLDANVWRESKWCMPKRQNKVFCYFLSEDIGQAMPILAEWARKRRYEVYLLSSPLDGRTLPRAGDYVHVCYSYGPAEFVKAISSSSFCITDSFHGLMYSSIFNVNCKFIRPTSEFRKSMFSRVEEFVENFVSGQILCNSIQEATDLFSSGSTTTYDQGKISQVADESLNWLKESIDNMRCS